MHRLGRDGRDLTVQHPIGERKALGLQKPFTRIVVYNESGDIYFTIMINRVILLLAITLPAESPEK